MRKRRYDAIAAPDRRKDLRGKNLKLSRPKKDTTQKALAEAIGVSRQIIHLKYDSIGFIPPNVLMNRQTA